MNATELDLPLMPSADQIRRREFATVRRGYDPGQVRDYLGRIADQVEGLERQARDAKMEAEATLRTQVEPRPDPYAELAARLADLMRAADEQAERIVNEAGEEARRILEEARSEADRVRLDAQSRAEEARGQAHEALRRAREESDRMLSGLTRRRESLVGQLHEMQERLLGVARELEGVIEPVEAEARTEADAESRPPSEELGGEVPPHRAAEPLDPRYEDLWSSTETVDLTMEDIPSLDLDLDDEEDGGS